jgi:hypothetical protein
MGVQIKRMPGEPELTAAAAAEVAAATTAQKRAAKRAMKTMYNRTGELRRNPISRQQG